MANNFHVAPKHPVSNAKWLKVIEFAVVSTATWLDPSAGGLLLLLQLCFQILAALPLFNHFDQKNLE